MRAPVAPLHRKLPVVATAALLALTFIYPASADEVASDTAASPLSTSVSDLTDGASADLNALRVEEHDDGAADSNIDIQPDASSPGSDAMGAPLLAASAAQISQDMTLQPLSESGDVPLVAKALAGEPAHFVNQTVSLDGGEPVLGSFTVDGMTYAVTGEGEVELAAVGNHMAAGSLAAGSSGAEGAGRGIGSGVPTSPQPQPAPSVGASGSEGEGSQEDPAEGALARATGSAAADPLAEGASGDRAAEGEGSSAGGSTVVPGVPSDGPMASSGTDAGGMEAVALAIPASVEHDGATYVVASVGPCAFAGCDAVAVVLPVTVASVDEAATRGSAVEAIEVAEGNQHLASYEGVLYDADYSSLLLIPEGKKGVVRIHSNTSAIAPGAFSHCASVTSVEVDAGNETFCVEDEVLYDTLERIRFYAYAAQGETEDSYDAESCLGRTGFDYLASGDYPSVQFDAARAANASSGTVVFMIPDGHSFFTGQSASSISCTLRHSGWTAVVESGFGSDPLSKNGLSYSNGQYRYFLGGMGYMRALDTRCVATTLGSPTGSSYLPSDLIGQTLYLHCTNAPIPCSVSWNSNGGNGGSSATVNKGDTSVAPTPSRTGYTFAGWYTAASGGSYVCGAGGSVTVASDVTYYAHWTPNPYTVNYHNRAGTYLGGGSVSYDQGFNLWGNPGGTAGYTPNGWATSAWQSSGSYGLGAWVSNLVTGGTVNLYLAESANPYTIRYHDKAGNHLGDQGAAYDQGLSLWGNPNRTGTGYTAQGWARSANQASRAWTFGQSVSNLATSGSINLYVAETANTYNVRYFTKDGAHIGTDVKSYDSWFNLRGDPGRTHPAYTARGWARSKNQTSASHAFALWTRNLASAQGANFDLYVAETANEYSISYDAKGGQLSGQRTKYTFETGDFRLAEPTRVGYTFTGWTVTGAQGNGIVASGASSTVRQGTWGNLSCTANWRANEYAVSLDPSFHPFANGSAYANYAPYGVTKDAGAASVTATFDSAMPQAAMPRATGYAFQGYFDQPNGAGAKYYEADGASVRAWDKPNAATLYGHWTLDRHELTLDVGNGEVPGAAARGWSRDAGEAGLYRLSYSIEWVEESGGSPRIQLPVPATKPGYAAFDGWVGGGISKPSKSVIVQPWELADKAYSGVFSGLVGYTAALDLAGGRLEEAPEGWSESGGCWSRGFDVESEGFSLPTPVCDGYAFEGWRAVGADGLGEPSKDVTVPKGSWGDRSWVASWRAIGYSITYELAGGTLSGQPTTYTVESPDFELPQPTRDGYSFEGWQVEGAQGAGLLQQGTTTTVLQGTWGDLHATATWATVPYTASLDLDGGSFASAPAGWSGSGGKWTRGFTVESDGFALPAPTRAGHEFKGWALVGADGSLGAPDPSASVPKGTVGDRSFRAVWEARSYTVTWHYAGQVIDGQQSVSSTQAYGEPIAFPGRPSEADPSREHYSFEGWFDEREGGERVEAGAYLLERDATFYARWVPVEYAVHLHLGDDDAYAEHAAYIEKDGAALPMAPDGHFDMAYTVEDEVALPTVTDDPSAMKPVREGMSFVGWVECEPDGAFGSDLVPSLEVILPVGSHGERHFRAVWAFALRFEVPSAVGFRFDLADDPAFADAPYGPVQAVSGDGVELRSLSLGQLAVADVQLDVAGADPDSIVTDRSKVMLRVRDASLEEPWVGWVPLPTTAAPEGIDPFCLADVGFGDANPVAPLASKPLLYQVEVQDPTTTLAGEVDGLPLAKVVFTVKGLW